MITNYLTELSNGEEIMTTMEPPTLFKGEETELQTTTEESEGNFSISGQIIQFRNSKLSFLYHLDVTKHVQRVLAYAYFNTAIFQKQDRRYSDPKARNS